MMYSNSWSNSATTHEYQNVFVTQQDLNYNNAAFFQREMPKLEEKLEKARFVYYDKQSNKNVDYYCCPVCYIYNSVKTIPSINVQYSAKLSTVTCRACGFTANLESYNFIAESTLMRYFFITHQISEEYENKTFEGMCKKQFPLIIKKDVKKND